MMDFDLMIEVEKKKVRFCNEDLVDGILMRVSC